ncbi:hypothetical protein V1511DRAFT_502346 [Dipodascopsis uninucleata]
MSRLAAFAQNSDNSSLMSSDENLNKSNLRYPGFIFVDEFPIKSSPPPKPTTPKRYVTKSELSRSIHGTPSQPRTPKSPRTPQSTKARKTPHTSSKHIDSPQRSSPIVKNGATQSSTGRSAPFGSFESSQASNSTATKNKNDSVLRDSPIRFGRRLENSDSRNDESITTIGRGIHTNKFSLDETIFINGLETSISQSEQMRGIVSPVPTDNSSLTKVEEPELSQSNTSNTSNTSHITNIGESSIRRIDSCSSFKVRSSLVSPDVTGSDETSFLRNFGRNSVLMLLSGNDTNIPHKFNEKVESSLSPIFNHSKDTSSVSSVADLSDSHSHIILNSNISNCSSIDSSLATIKKKSGVGVSVPSPLNSSASNTFASPNSSSVSNTSVISTQSRSPKRKSSQKRPKKKECQVSEYRAPIFNKSYELEDYYDDSHEAVNLSSINTTNNYTAISSVDFNDSAPPSNNYEPSLSLSNTVDNNKSAERTCTGSVIVQQPSYANSPLKCSRSDDNTCQKQSIDSTPVDKNDAFKSSLHPGTEAENNKIRSINSLRSNKNSSSDVDYDQVLLSARASLYKLGDLRHHRSHEEVLDQPPRTVRSCFQYEYPPAIEEAENEPDVDPSSVNHHMRSLQQIEGYSMYDRSSYKKEGFFAKLFRRLKPRRRQKRSSKGRIGS